MVTENHRLLTKLFQWCLANAIGQFNITCDAEMTFFFFDGDLDTMRFDAFAKPILAKLMASPE